MNCDKVKELILTDYSDKELDSGIAVELGEHLLGCVKCAEFAETYPMAALAVCEIPVG